MESPTRPCNLVDSELKRVRHPYHSGKNSKMKLTFHNDKRIDDVKDVETLFQRPVLTSLRSSGSRVLTSSMRDMNVLDFVTDGVKPR